MKVFSVRCWNTPRGHFLVAAKTAKSACVLMGCSPYHLRTYSMDGNAEERKLALSNIGKVFHRADYKSSWKLKEIK